MKPKFYVGIDVSKDKLDVAVKEKSDPRFAVGLRGFLSERGGSAEDYSFFPFTGRHGTCVLVFAQDGELLDGIDCRAI